MRCSKVVFQIPQSNIKNFIHRKPTTGTSTFICFFAFFFIYFHLNTIKRMNSFSRIPHSVFAVFIITKRQSKVHCNLTYCWYKKKFHLQFTHKCNVIQNKLQTCLCAVCSLFFFWFTLKIIIVIIWKSSSKQQRQKYFLWKYFYYFFMFFFSLTAFSFLSVEKLNEEEFKM